MGLCGSSGKVDKEKDKDDKKKSRDMERELNKSHNDEQQVNKLLLLGAGESGKSTLFKQMMSIYGKGFTEHDRAEFTPIVFSNVLGGMKMLCEQSDELNGKFAGVQTLVRPELQPSKQYIADLKENSPIDPTMAQHLEALWRDPGIQNTYALRSTYQLSDSVNYFLDKIREIGTAGYVPSEQDVLRSRVRTTGIVEQAFRIDGNEFKMFDVGGQRNERKKWIHCFSNVTAVLFVAALSEYDKKLYEDEDTNRMDEALNLFDEICNSRWFKKTSIILMLNKRDLFREKIATVPITICFNAYDGNTKDYDECVKYIARQFETKKKDTSKNIYTHVTCATDKDNCRVVFNAVKDIVIRRSLQDGGLLT